MKKIAIVVQRYSQEINGGAEFHARLLAEHLSAQYEVEVLTTCAKDYLAWENFYPEGVQVINGIKVLRFKSASKNWKEYHKLFRYLRRNLKYSVLRPNLHNFLALPFLKFYYRRRKDHSSVFEKWIEEQGPQCRDLVSFVAKEKDSYGAFIFFTYLYYPTYKGVQAVSEKSVLIPTAHDEPAFYFEGFRDLFSSPRFIMYNSPSEKKLVESVYPGTKEINADIAGVGIDEDLIRHYGSRPLENRYFVYIGRIVESKGCADLIAYFLRYKETTTERISLVLIGKNQMKTVTDKGIVYTGFIQEEEKFAYLQHSEALIIPSRFESLSMVTLEAMALGKPVLANGHCEVLRSHIENSKAGYTYYNKKDFNDKLKSILNLTTKDKSQILENGRIYVQKNYNWHTIISKFVKAIEYISSTNQTKASAKST